jgi:hypothetical protein
MRLTPVLLILLLITSGCENDDGTSGYNKNFRGNISPDVFLKIGRHGSEFTFEDIQLYDSSTHIIYFKDKHPEFISFSDILNGPFYFLDKGNIIYSGSFVPSYSSFIPAGPFIMSPGFYGEYALRIDMWWDNKSDVRNCPGLIGILKDHGLLHSGLSGSIDFINISGDKISLGFTVLNRDNTDLLILDINKMGRELFHYFTNGLYIIDMDHNNIFSSSITPQQPDPWNGWKTEWLSLIKSGESMSFTVDYPLLSPISRGDYSLSFEFPGLAYQVSMDDLYQGNSRIWLGDISLKGRASVH